MYKPKLLEASRKRARERDIKLFYTGTCRDCRKRTGNKCGHWYMVCTTVCVRAIIVLHEQWRMQRHTHTV